jgi:hypothetical protein
LTVTLTAPLSTSCGGDRVDLLAHEAALPAGQAHADAPPPPSGPEPHADEPTLREKLDDLEQLEIVPRGEAVPLPEWAAALDEQCRAGEIERCVDLATALHDGYDVPQDWEGASDLLTKACREKSERGCDLLAALAGKDMKAASTATAVLKQACTDGVATACEATKSR